MSIKIFRAHNYEPIEQIRCVLARVPSHWLEQVAHIPFVVLPDDLSPIWIGLMREEYTAHDGRKYSSIGAWSCGENYDSNWRHAPHLYFKERSARFAVHEMAHALDDAWHVDTQEFFEPNTAFYNYMASNESEYFACALEAFLTSSGDDTRWNNYDLAKRNYNLWLFLRNKLGEAM